MSPSEGAPLFTAGGYRCRLLDAACVADLQSFYEANPAYFLNVEGQPPGPRTAQEAFDARPPEGWTYDRKIMVGFHDDKGALVAMADIISNLFVAGIWHIGLFVVASRLHGSAASGELYRGLEGWMLSQGARWLRLGVVIGNTRAERFWERMGYTEVRKRTGIAMGKRVNDLRVMVKPLTGESRSMYLAAVARDREDA